MANLFTRLFSAPILIPPRSSQEEYEAQTHVYIFENSSDKSDFIIQLCYNTPIFTHDITPRRPFFQGQGGQLHMHIRTRGLLVVLHKLGV